MFDIFSYAVREWRKFLKKAGVDSDKFELRFIIDGTAFSEAYDKADKKPAFDADYDDAFKAEIEKGSGTVTATNARSCLIAVYECLRRLGFVFLTPTDLYIPQGLVGENVNLRFVLCAENRYRGVAPCAPKEINSFRRFIKWLPKVGFNTVFFEGISGYLAYKSWYKHEKNPFYAKEKFDLETAKKFDAQCLKLARRLGLSVHAMGHGWNVAAITDNAYNDMFPEKGQKIRYEYVATVNGNKEIPDNILRCANLCLSKKEVKEKLVKLVVDYVKNNRSADVVHFWLADGANRTCECDD